MGIDADGVGSTEATEFGVSAGWTRICVTLNSATDTATLHVNGVAGTGSGTSVKTYSSLIFQGNLRLGAVDNNSALFSPVGDTFDDFKLYTSVVSCADDYAAWQTVAPPPTGTFEQKTHQWRKLRKTAGGAIDSYGSAGATVPVMQGGAVILDVQVDCTVANCAALAGRLLGNVNGGAFTAVPNTDGANKHYFYGSTTDPDILTGAVTCCLTGALTQNDGGTQFTADAIPVFDLGQDGSIVQRYVLRVSSTATVGDTMCFKMYSQDGNVLNTYTPSGGACLTVVGPSAGIGF
jgi:hypothetical protein